MLDELVSGFLGRILSELLQKVAPPRQFAELSGADFETLTRRNQHLYVICGCAGWLGFVSSFLYAICDWRWSLDFPLRECFRLECSLEFLRGSNEYANTFDTTNSRVS